MLRWTIPASFLLALGAVCVLGWGRPDAYAWSAAAFAGCSIGLQAMRYRAVAIAYRRELEGGLMRRFEVYLQSELKKSRANSDRIVDAMKELQN